MERNDPSSGNATKEQDALSVSIAREPGSHLASDATPVEGVSIEDSMTAALDDAVAQLDAAVGCDVSPEETDPQTAILSLIDLLLQSPSRRDAIVALVDYLEPHVGSCTVRCGYGKTKLVQLYDRKFGWLGSESSLYEEMARHWDAPRRRASDSAEEKAAAICRGNTLRFVLPKEDKNARYEVWISGDDVSSGNLGLVHTSAFGCRFGNLESSDAYLAGIRKTVGPAQQDIHGGGLHGAVLAGRLGPCSIESPATRELRLHTNGMFQRPFDATLLSAKVKPGDHVRKDDVLLVLDGRPLRLERESVEAEMQQAAKEHDVALVTGRVAEAQQAALKEQQFRREYDLLSDRLGRLEVVSPIDGVVVSGDLQRHEGSTLDRGQSLIEVAPMDKMILEVELPEYEIGYVKDNAETRVKIAALGGRSFTLPLQDVFPRSELRDDKNVFIGRIELDNTDGKLRPGMQGEATTYGPLRPWIWSWVRGAVERTLWWIGY